MEQIRCVKELRAADVLRGRTGEFIRPRFMVWENVPGAFSSGKPKGADFAAVIEEIIKVAEPDAYVCVMPPSSGWTKSGCYYDRDGRWSIAWRVHDAQFWGVPQRRKRISLIADFGGLSAPEILFERKGLLRDSEQSGAQREGTPRTTGKNSEGAECFCLQGNGIDRADTAKCNGSGWREGVSYTLNTIDRPAVLPFDTTQITSPQNGNKPHYGDPCHPLAAGAHAPAVVVNYGSDVHENPRSEPLCVEMTSTKNTVVTDGISPTLTARMGTGGNQANAVAYAPTYCIEGNGQRESHRGDGYTESDTMYTLNTAERHAVAQPIALDRAFYNQGINAQYDPQLYEDGTCPTLVAKGPGAVCTRYIVRRLTPLECERLQGYPDGWTDIGEWVDSKGKKRKDADSPRYKALGNSIALPFWKWMLKRISAQYEREATLGSLFDGIGGFPLCWEQINGKGTARWASEIEEFPIAVTKIHFPEE